MTVAEARTDLELKLALQGLRVLEASGQASPPCVFVVPGDPWLAPAQLGGRYRTVTFRCIGLIGLYSDAAMQDDAEAMAQELADAIHASPPWTLVTVDPPAAYDVGGQAYLAVIGSTSLQLGGIP